eukprot:237217_1
MGGKVIFEQECKTSKLKNNPSITHQIMDRTLHSSKILNTRQYIQPQWIFDCLNTGAVIPTEHYQIGIQCPPHLSPFVSYNDQSHKPSQAFVLEHWKNISKQFGGFVPSKKLRENNTANQKQETVINDDDDEEDINEQEQEITMNLDIADIMDLDDITDKNDEHNDNQKEKVDEAELNGFVDDEEDDEDEDDEVEQAMVDNEEDIEEEEVVDQDIKKQSILDKQRLKIASKQRRKFGKQTAKKHSLETDGIPGSHKDFVKVNLARTMMAKKFRKQYDKIRRNKTSKSKHIKYMDKKKK